MLVLIYDKENKQQDYMYMAKDIYGNYVEGYVVVEKSWYSNEKDWKYYIVRNEYSGGGMCGGAIDLGTHGVLVDKTTIQPLTQKAIVAYELSVGRTVRIDKKFYPFGDDEPQDNVIRYIRKHEDMEGLWENE